MIAQADKIAYIGTENVITVLLNGQTKTIQVRSKSHHNSVILALEKFKKSPQLKADLQELETFFAPIKRIVVEFDSRFELDDNGRQLFLAGTKIPMPPALGDKILNFLEHGLPVEPLVKFWESCLRNPHYVAVEELFVFLTENQLPITDDGGFLGYKKLNFIKGEERIDVPDVFEELTIVDDIVIALNGSLVSPTIAKQYQKFVEETKPVMVDVHSGTIKQKVGEIVRIERIKLNEEARREQCGYGLHIGAFSYAFSGHVRVLCKVFPEDVIACNEGQAKLRTCKYQIVSFVDEAKEVKELLIDLTSKYVERQASECNYDVIEDDFPENDFSEGDTVKCTEDDGGGSINEGKYYYVISSDGGEILVIDDEGEQVWVDASYFELKD